MKTAKAILYYQKRILNTCEPGQFHKIADLTGIAGYTATFKHAVEDLIACGRLTQIGNTIKINQ